MHCAIRASAILALVSFSYAQQTFTAPPGYGTTEGPAAQTLYVPWFDGMGGRYQWSSGSNRGTPRPNINKLEMRRDGLAAASTTWAARTTTLTVVMGHTNMTTLSTTFASNYVGATTTVVNAMPYNVPNHNVPPPVAPPAPWTVSVPFTANFTYNGTDDLLWEMICTNSAPTGAYSTDAHAGGAGTRATLGTACSFTQSGNAPAAVGGNRIRMQLWASGGPNSQPAALVVGLTDPNTNLGGMLCTALRANTDIVIGMSTSATGTIGSSTAPISFDFNAPVVNTTVYTQFAAYDPASTFPIPFRLTAGATWNLLANPVSVSILWYDGANPSTAVTGFRSGTPTITQFTY